MVMAIKQIRTNIPTDYSVNFHNFEDGKDLNFSGSTTESTNTWIPYQTSGKQIRIQVKVKDENDNFRLDVEFYLWDDNHKLQSSTPHGVETILTVSGSIDVGIVISIIGVQAHFM